MLRESLFTADDMSLQCSRSTGPVRFVPGSLDDQRLTLRHGPSPDLHRDPDELGPPGVDCCLSCPMSTQPPRWTCSGLRRQRRLVPSRSSLPTIRILVLRPRARHGRSQQWQRARTAPGRRPQSPIGSHGGLRPGGRSLVPLQAASHLATRNALLLDERRFAVRPSVEGSRPRKCHDFVPLEVRPYGVRVSWFFHGHAPEQ